MGSITLFCVVLSKLSSLGMLPKQPSLLFANFVAKIQQKDSATKRMASRTSKNIDGTKVLIGKVWRQELYRRQSYQKLKPPTTPRILIVTHVKKRFLQMSFLVGIKNFKKQQELLITTRSWRLKTKEKKRKEKSLGSYIYCT